MAGGAIVRAIARAVSFVFYRVEVAGRVPGEGAALLLPNHQNALLDPALIWATSTRHVRFLAKSTLFGTPLRPVLAAAGAIPVYRRTDEGVDASRNTETFAAVAAALAHGEAVCLFPEGISHSAGRLVELRTGAARMALTAAGQGVDVALVPVGLNFDDKGTFRSRVTVTYGRPFSCADLAAAGPRQDAVLALTDRIGERMRALIIEADPAGDAALVERIARLYRSVKGKSATAEEEIARRRLIASGIERLRADERERYDAILLRVRRYDDRLRRFGLRDPHLDFSLGTADAVRFAAREIPMAIVLVPAAAAGLALFAVPYYVTAAIASVNKEKDVTASAKAIGGAVIYAVWLIALVTIATRLWGGAAGSLTLVAAPLLALAGLFAIERETSVFRAVRAWFQLRSTRDSTRKQLRRARSELADILELLGQELQEQQ
jgi:glycerol-3-phosphate O-acyltransferase/dihydroxyacetone phosphate acyltransferase